jgi:hypothetical protein
MSEKEPDYSEKKTNKNKLLSLRAEVGLIDNVLEKILELARNKIITKESLKQVNEAVKGCKKNEIFVTKTGVFEGEKKYPSNTKIVLFIPEKGNYLYIRNFHNNTVYVIAPLYFTEGESTEEEGDKNIFDNYDKFIETKIKENGNDIGEPELVLPEIIKDKRWDLIIEKIQDLIKDYLTDEGNEILLEQVSLVKQSLKNIREGLNIEQSLRDILENTKAYQELGIGEEINESYLRPELKENEDYSKIKANIKNQFGFMGGLKELAEQLLNTYK